MATTDLKSSFLLDPSVTYLNFGSFGACLKPVFERYQQYQLELEREPVQFIKYRGQELLKTSRAALGRYLNCGADDLVYVTNPSYAINIVARGLKLQPGDEILSTNLEYGALDSAWRYYCNQAGYKFVRQPIKLPLTTVEDFLDNFFAGFTTKTRAIFISHITSATALNFPVRELCARAKEIGLITIVDGAHAPGQVPVDLQDLQADIYTGACHKWMCTPKGSSFLFVKPEYQNWFDPLVISWGYDAAPPSSSRFQDYHQGQGTRDFSAFLTIPAALEFMEQHNWLQVAADCRKLAQDNYERFCKLVGAQPLCPISDDFLVQMAAVPIHAAQPEALLRHLFEQYRIEVAVNAHETGTYLRYSIQAFNSQADLDRLYEALTEIKNTTRLLD